MLKWTLVTLFGLYVLQLIAGNWIKLPDRSEGPAPPPVVEASWDDPAVLQACPTFSGSLPADTEAAMSAVVVLEDDSSQGSGTFVSPDGVILTAAHVVDESRVVDVRTRDGRSFTARKIRVDVLHDVALLQVEGLTDPVPCLTAAMGDPSLGTEVFVLGAPEGLEFSVSKGIVSSLRTEHGQRFVQTDASVNPGNSGGPMLDNQGRVIGVVSWKRSDAEGLGFAVPVTDTFTYLNLASGPSTVLPKGPVEKGAAPFLEGSHHSADGRVPVERWFWLNPIGSGQWKPWQPLTSLLLNGRIFDAVIDWLMLFFFWAPVQSMMGRKRFLTGLGVAIVGSMVLTHATDLIGGLDSGMQYVGLTPVWTALIVFFGLSMPKATIRLFFILPIKAIWVVWGTGVLGLLWFLYNRDLNAAIGLYAWICAFGFMYVGEDRIKQFWLRRQARKRAKEMERFTVIPGGKGGDDYIH